MHSYEALGLLSSIPLASKGSKGKGAADDEEDLPESLVSGYGQIVRDADGNVIDIILPDEPQDDEDDEDKELPKVEAKTAIAKSEYMRWFNDVSILTLRSGLPELEVISSTTNKPVIRHTSNNEREWLLSMVEAYGDDTEAMGKDIKRNVWQRTKGEINRM